MSKILILDDDQGRHTQFKRNMIGHVLTHVETVDGCILALETEEYDYVCLDHDLGGKQMVMSGRGTGYEVAQWMAKTTINEEWKHRMPLQVFVHSLNPAGRKNIVGELKSAGIRASERPFLWTQKVGS